MEPQMEQIKLAANGLLFISESEHPLEPFILNSKESPEKEIKKLAGKSDGDPVEKQEVDYFFRNHIKTYPGDPEEETVRANRFQTLIKTLKNNLTDIRVYRVGSVQVDAFIIGKLKDGRYAGLRTKLIET